MGKRLFRAGFLPRALLLLVCCLGLCACGAQTPPRIAVFALDGPPLAVAGAQGDIELIESSDDAARLHGMAGSAGTSGMADVKAAPDTLDTPDMPDMPGQQVLSADDNKSQGALPVTAPPAYRVVNEVRFSGEMERGLLAGIGRFSLENPATGLVCAGDVDTAPSRTGRFRGIVSCGNGEFFLFTLSHQGPDQGAGVGRFASAPATVGALKTRDSAKAVDTGESVNAAETANAGDAVNAGDATKAGEATNVEDTADAGKAAGSDLVTGTEKAVDTDTAPELTIHNGPPVLFFYHPWREEAERRLADMQKNLAAHIKGAEDKKVD